MLKEVGASGQISLGKKYAGKLFDLQTQEDGSIVMRPVKVVPVAPTTTESNRPNQSQSISDWAQAHEGDIAQYNAWASQAEPYSQRVRRWREQEVTKPEPTHGAV